MFVFFGEFYAGGRCMYAVSWANLITGQLFLNIELLQSIPRCKL